MVTPLFECRNLVKRYGPATVVDDLSFAISPGECLGVIGPNGAGKTTTIRMCLGLTTPDAGSITAFGLDMPRDALAIKAQLGVVSQMDTLDPDFSCAENLLVYGRYFGMSRAQIAPRIPQLLDFAALAHKANAKPGGNANAFWLDVNTISRSHKSASISAPLMPLTESTMIMMSSPPGA